jgi:hypothetical protein
MVSYLRHSRNSASSILWKLRSRKKRRREKRPYLLKTPVTNECLSSFTTLNAKYHFLIYVLLCLQFAILRIINLCNLLSHILFTSLKSSQSIYYRDFYSRKSQKHYFNRSRLLRDNISSQFFINRAKCIDCNYYNINYKVRCYMLSKSIRRLADNFKNSISTPNRPINWENILLSLPAEILEQSKN